MKLVVFDSGRGGVIMAERLKQLLPFAEIITISDTANVPYGSKNAETITHLTEQALKPALGKGYDAIVLACNTATVTAIQYLRTTYPNETFVGIEPMVKPAATLTHTRHVAVLATPATLASDRYRELKKLYAEHISFHEPDCVNWASLIEHGDASLIPLKETLTPLIKHGVDTVLLACTHYSILTETIEKMFPGVTVLEPTDAIAGRIEFLMESS